MAGSPVRIDRTPSRLRAGDRPQQAGAVVQGVPARRQGPEQPHTHAYRAPAGVARRAAADGAVHATAPWLALYQS
ncbi:hypothetical protein CBM2589_A90052 [Cupriavidus taiwanensis]|uniref:Uncharacterized protein n=1 Tax=Cupriavidus taiwanensis TaxID=164546 RepID=A0A375CER5_9BURK|nr:hypothetical protein CBM2589_A90052 [Cupriavidus taiwanensis]